MEFRDLKEVIKFKFCFKGLCLFVVMLFGLLERKVC